MGKLPKITKVGLMLYLIGSMIMLIFMFLSKPIPDFAMCIFGAGIFIVISSVIFTNKEP